MRQKVGGEKLEVGNGKEYRGRGVDFLEKVEGRGARKKEE